MNFLDPAHLVEVAGPIGVALIILGESGIPFAFFFPGASLLFAAGIFASLGFFSVWSLVIYCFIGAIIGDAIGFYIGHYIGEVYFEKERRFIKKKHLDQSKEFFKKHGIRAIILARFIPVVRTFVPLIAGVSRMNVRLFFTYNIIGAALWTITIPLIAYFIGGKIPHLKEYITPIGILIILVTCIPIFLEWRKSRKNSVNNQ